MVRLHHIVIAGLVAILAMSSSSASAQTCEAFFAETKPLFEVLADGAVFQELQVGPVTAEQMLSFHPEMLLQADEVAQKLRFLPRASRVRTVLYPAAGYDAATAFRIFTHATTVIGLDNHPFDSHRGAAFGTIQDYTGWVHYSDLDRLNSMSGAIVRSVLSLGPEIRILRFQAIYGAGRVEGQPATHGIVEFDQGPGTTRRRYVHIHTATHLNRGEAPSWVNSLMHEGYDAILAKASMHAFIPYSTSLGGSYVDHLRERNGLMVDGDGDIAQWPWKGDSKMMTAMKIRELRTHITGLGYGHVNILTFGEE